MSRALSGSVLVALALTTVGPPPAAAEDLRSVERLVYRCTSPLGRRDVTLFGNGTLRLRERSGDDERMDLAELPPEELQIVLDQLTAEDPTDDPFAALRMPSGIVGDWVESCELRLALPDREPLRFTFGRYDTRELQVGRLIAVAERLALRAIPERRSEVPEGYEPTYGDVLLDARGQRWRALWITEDRRGVELQGLDQPVRRIVDIEALPSEYVAFERKN